MKYQNTALRQMLSAEYVLGTLRGLARRRFDRLIRKDAALQREVQFWEARLNRLALEVKPVDPPETVWISLQKRIEQGNTVQLRPASAVAAKRAGPAPWRIVAGLAAAAAVVLAVLLSQPKTPADLPVAVVPAAPAAESYVALLKMPDSDMQWTVSLTPARGRMTVAALGAAPQLGDRSPELWWLSPSGPVAIGVLPVQGGGSMPLPAALANATELKLAVSLEPHGGSPTGQPTGPVVTSAVAVHTA
jgi:anti-sigma-K factor RskA